MTDSVQHMRDKRRLFDSYITIYRDKVGRMDLVAAMQLALESLDLRIPEKPVTRPLLEDAPEYGELICCPHCGDVIYDHKYRAGPMPMSGVFAPARCQRCGQVLDWGKDTPPQKKKI